MSSLGPISAGVTRYLQISAVVQYFVTPADIWSCRRYRHVFVLCCAAVARYSITRLCCCTMAVDVVGAMSTMALLTSHVVKKIPFPSRRTHRPPPPPPFNPNNTPPLRAHAPSPNVHPKACDACVDGGGFGGGQRRCEGAEERDTMVTTTTTTTTTTTATMLPLPLPLPQTERTTSACAVEP